MFDVKLPNDAYIYGFFQADASFREITRNRGSIACEIKKNDELLLKKISKYLPVNTTIRYRTRDTNFKNNYQSVILSIFDKDFRYRLKELGMAPGPKRETASPPDEKFSKADFFRGIVDGDGSLGVTTNGYPFVSLATSSLDIKESWEDFIELVTDKHRNTNRNNRDNSFNIMVQKEAAQQLVKEMYYENCLCLQRKEEKVDEMQQWERPSGMRRSRSSKTWDDEQDDFILNHSIAESMTELDRTRKSVKTRLWRLGKTEDKDDITKEMI